MIPAPLDFKLQTIILRASRTTTPDREGPGKVPENANPVKKENRSKTQIPYRKGLNGVLFFITKTSRLKRRKCDAHDLSYQIEPHFSTVEVIGGHRGVGALSFRGGAIRIIQKRVHTENAEGTEGRIALGAPGNAHFQVARF